MTRSQWLVLLFAFPALAACATDHAPPPEPRTVVVEKKVPVIVPCPETMPAAPTFPDTRAAVKAAPSAEDRFRLLAAGWPLRLAWIDTLESVIDACRKPKPPP